MDVKKCDRCGCIIEKKDTYMWLDGSLTSKNGSLTQGHYLMGHLCENCVNALEKFMNREELEPEPEKQEPEASEEAHDFEPENAIDRLIEFCNSTLANIEKSIIEQFELLDGTLYIAGEPQPEPEEDPEDEEPKTSKFVDMVLQARSIMGNDCDSHHLCKSCPFNKDNCRLGLAICQRNHVDGFVREFIIRAANDPIVQQLVFSHYAESCARDAYKHDDAMLKKAKKLSSRLLKDLEG